jgi:HD-like signal output (HDOD) protein
VLPTLPEIALKARKLLNDNKSTSTQISKVISADAVISTRLLRVVNSPLYRTQSQIEDVRMAITRLGNGIVRSLVTSLAMEQVYRTKLSPQTNILLKQNWEHSVQVAALSQLIAQKFTSLSSEEAMLGGLIHDIGKLPILEYSERIPELVSNQKALQKVLAVLHPQIGSLILKTWNFQPYLIAVTTEHEKLDRNPDSGVDYVDVVLIANILSYIGTDHPYTKMDWSKIPAFNRLNLPPEECISTIKAARDEIAQIRQLISA